MRDFDNPSARRPATCMCRAPRSRLVRQHREQHPVRTRARGGKEHGRTPPTHPKKRLLVLRETPRLLLNRFRKTIPHAQIAAGLEQLANLTRVTLAYRDSLSPGLCGVIRRFDVHLYRRASFMASSAMLRGWALAAAYVALPCGRRPGHDGPRVPWWSVKENQVRMP